MLNEREPTELGWHITRKMAAHEPPLTQSDLARRTGLSQSTISRYIYSPGRPETDKLQLLAAALDTDYGELLVIAGHGRPADTAAVTRPIHPLARELDLLLGPESHLSPTDREELERGVDRWLMTFRKSRKRHRSA